MLIIDTNSWHKVFDANDKEHLNFAPVKEYILSHANSLAWGGSKFVKETAGKYRRLLVQLEKAKRAIRFDDSRIDAEEARISAALKHSDFNDPHIIAIQVVSKAEVIVSGDKESYPFLTRKDLYPKNHTRPKIYRGPGNEKLLCGGAKSRPCEDPMKVTNPKPRRKCFIAKD